MSKWMFAIILILLSIFPGNAEADFAKVKPGKNLSFPRAHGAHPDYPLEWWYFTGHLSANSQNTYGFELTFFRVGIAGNPLLKSRRPADLIIGHFAVTDDNEQRFLFAEKMSRQDYINAGASTDTLRVWTDDWLAVLSDDRVELRASATDKESGLQFSLAINLELLKPPVLHGQNGFSRKGPAAGEASYYMSLTRLQGSGELEIGGKRIEISSATAWMDHEVVSFEPQSPNIGWDWFSLQLDNNEELMLYHLYRGEQSPSSYSKGSLIRADGSLLPLDLKDYSIKASGSWTSPKSGQTYPSGWLITVPSENLSLTVTPTLKDQEIRSEATTGVNYWEGRCTIKGTRGSEVIEGNAYVELVPLS